MIPPGHLPPPAVPRLTAREHKPGAAESAA